MVNYLKEVIMILTIVAVLVLLWVLGLVTSIGGSLIHLLLVVALVVFIWDRLVAHGGRA
jgi:hypothetical protein